MRVKQIISGAQTGADRGALEAAIALGIPHGGWVPRGRKAEDGEVPAKFLVRETRSAYYVARTEQNVVEADATLVFTVGPAGGGTKKTIEFAERRRKPYRVIDLDAETDAAGAVAIWLAGFDRAIVLNVAGPRESSQPGLAGRVRGVLERALTKA